LFTRVELSFIRREFVPGFTPFVDVSNNIVDAKTKSTSYSSKWPLDLTFTLQAPEAKLDNSLVDE